MEKAQIWMCQLSLSERDKYLLQIEKQIQSRREFLLKKRAFFENIADKNEFLEEVRKDYTKYYDHLSKQKGDELSAMNTIKEYLDDLIINGKLSEDDVLETKKEQREILKEMDNIQHRLDGLIRGK